MNKEGESEGEYDKIEKREMKIVMQLINENGE